MFQKVRSRKTSSKSRTNPAKRGKRSKPVCESGATAKKLTKVIADRFRTVTFEPLSGVHVAVNRGGLDTKDNPGTIYSDLWDCYSRYYFLVHGRLPAFTFHEISATLSSAFSKLLMFFQELIGDLNFNIERTDEGKFRFVIWAYGSWKEQWHIFPIKNTVYKLRETNIELHDLFLEFLGAFCASTSIDLWFQDTMYYAFQWYEENIENLSNEGIEEEDLQEYNDLLAEYREGEIKVYAETIRSHFTLNLAEVREKALSFNIDHPIITLIVQGCEVASKGGNIHHYIYNPFEDNEDEDNGREGLPFEYQSTVIWDFDGVFYQQEEYLNDIVNNYGIQFPVVWHIVDHSTETLFQPDYWTGELSKFFDRGNELLNQFTNEQNNETAK